MELVSQQSIVPIVLRIALVQRGNNVWAINAVQPMLVATGFVMRRREKIAETAVEIVSVLRGKFAKTTLVWP
jgi:hypothetical protein